MKRFRVLAVVVAAVALVLPAAPANAGDSVVFIGGGPAFPFSLCAEFGTAPNNWILTVQVSDTVFVQYGSDDAVSRFSTRKKTGSVTDRNGIGAQSSAHPILAKLTATYKAGGRGVVDFVQTSPIHVKYHLAAPAVVDLSANCSAAF